jgi:putative addiction module component (TIGR02574 family)
MSSSALDYGCLQVQLTHPCSAHVPPGFDELSVDEKIGYLQSLWDRIAATPQTIPVPDWHREVLDERLKDLETDPGASDSRERVQERLWKKFDTSH